MATISVAAGPAAAGHSEVSATILPRALAFVGAGIYEEVLFRLLLLPAFYLGFRAMQAGVLGSTILAVLASSLAFSLAHYVGPAGESIVPFTFLFRTLAGIFFATLFFARGFGITVGAHAVYDLIVGVLLAGSRGEF
ncbi:CPBP family glutamic-type intramembrane protease [Stratiformator vulcanicus]